MAIPKLRPLEPDTYHGVTVMDMHAGDPIPMPRAPERYAVSVSPDLARYLLTLNHEHNRRLKAHHIKKYTADMAADLWRFSPESIVFSGEGVLQDGQNRLAAVIEYGHPVWMMLDFGWPDELITTMNRGSARINSDAFKIYSVPSPAIIAATIAQVARYDAVVGQTRGFSGLLTPTSEQALAIYQQDPDGWNVAGRTGARTYDALDKGLSPTAWASCYRVIARVRPAEVDGFFAEVADGSGAARSATRVLADFYRRRPVSATRTGDNREPMENVIRAFNAYRSHRALSFVTRSGFELVRVR